MTKQLATFLVTAAIVACGSKPPPPTAPAHEVAADKPVEPPPPANPTKPADPPKPAEEIKPAEPPKPDPVALAAAETAAYDKAKPLFTKYCASCHTKAGKKATKKKLDHFSMDAYPFGGAHTKSIGNEIRVVLAIDGKKKPTMPYDKPGSVKGDDLAMFKAWTEAWQASGAAGNHPVEPADKDDD